MKKILLGLFFIFSVFTYADTTVSWNVEKSYRSGYIIVTCELRGDIYSNFEVEVKPFGMSALSDGSDDDYNLDLTLNVEKEINSNDEVAYYKCSLEKDYDELATFYFRVKNVMVIESM